MYELFINSGEIFLHILNISITASWLVLAVLLARLLLKKSPKWVNCLLWAIVALRLLVPFNIESNFSLVPSSETIPVSEIYAPQSVGGLQTFAPEVDSGFQVVDSVIQPIISETSTQPVLQSNVSIIACVWLVGIIAMLVYALVSFLRIKKSISQAMRVQDNIYICDDIATPFILGIVRPKIYLPSSLYKEDVLYVIDHEKSHIKRLDHLWKPLGFLVLTFYWFNPVMWVAYIYLCKDIELACDEKAIKEFDIQAKKEYSNALINCSSQRRLVSACPLAFGETGVKNRIKSVLSYKKPAFWVILISLVLCVAVCVGFLTVPDSPSVKKILDQKGYKIVAQEDAVIPLSIPVSVFTDEIYSEKGQEFRKNQVIVFKYDNTGKSYCQTNIYLEEAVMHDSRVDLSFRFSYDRLQDCGVVYTGYYAVDNWYPTTIHVNDVNTLKIDGEHYYEDEVAERFWAGSVDSDGGIGFSICVSKDAFLKAKDEIVFDIFCTKTGYEKNSRYRLIDDDLCKFIEETILEKEGWTTTQDKFSCVSFIPLKAEKIKGNTKVYLCAQWNQYEMVNGTLVFSGEKTPHLATITIKSEDSGYSLVDYWTLDGYKSSVDQIEEHFPEKCWEEAKNGIGYYYDVLHMKNKAKENEFFAGKTKDYTGEYIFYGSRETIKPTLVLKENNSFVFNYSHLSSEFLTGQYEMPDGHHLMLHADGNKSYRFTVTDEGFVFDAFNSSEIPEYKVSADSSETYCPVPDNAVFIEKQVVGANSYFDATVLEVNESSILVEPFPNEPVCKSANKLSVSTRLSSSMKVPYLRVGDEIRICYDGMIQETFPAQINGTIAIYMLESCATDENNYTLGYDGATKITYMLHNDSGETGGEIADEQAIKLFVQRFNEALDSSSIDEEKADDKDFDDNIAYVYVDYADGSQASIRILGEERIRLGVNERRLISQYDKEQIIDALIGNKDKIIMDIANGNIGKVSLNADEFLKKAYALTNSETKEELKRIFGIEPGITQWEAIETYYFTNGEYVLLIGPNTRVELRRVSDLSYRHTIA